MNSQQIATITISVLLPVSVYAANPFLDAKGDKPASAKFHGSEWGDEIQGHEIPLTGQVVTTRIAKMPWGAIFRIEFADLKSHAEKQREIGPDCFIVTDNRIVLLSEEDNDAAAKKISALDKPPEFEPNDIYGVSSGGFEHQEGSGKRQLN